MKCSSSITVTLVALALIAAGVHGQQAAAQLPQSQVKPIPTPKLTLRWLYGLTLDKTTTVGGSVNGDITATVRLLRSAVSPMMITISTEGCLLDEAGIIVASTPTSWPISAGSDHGTFRIQTFSSPSTLNPVTCTVWAHYGEERVTASFTVEPLSMTSFTIVPPAGMDPFTATANIILNARPAVERTIMLTSSNPLVRFGSNAATAQPTASVSITSTRSQGTIQVHASGVQRQTTATITATMGMQTRTLQVTVRPPF